jgi:hypothetical protein
VKTAPYVTEPLVLPESIDAPDAAEFLEFVELSDALVLEAWGNPDRSSSAKARLRYWSDNPCSQLRLFFVRLDGRMVARSWIRLGLQENLHTADLHVNVLAQYAGRGIGTALPQPGQAEPGTTQPGKAGDAGRLNGGVAQ